MTKLPVFVALALGACTTTPSGTGAGIALVAPTSDFTGGNSFRCMGQWPSSMTPCQTPWQSEAATFSSDGGNHTVDLELARTPIPVDGGSSTVHIELQFAPDGTITPSVYEATTRAGDVATLETSDAVSGWIQPEAVSSSSDERNAGRFDLAFSWGEILGQYDTRPPMP